MSQTPRTRSVFGMIFKNFMDSLKPRQFRGSLIGTDYFGNKYYEIIPKAYSNKTKPSRWFEPAQKENFEQEMPAEWESWLRGRRKEPPSSEEIAKNVAIMEMKKRNAIEVSKKSGKPTPMEKGMESFPKLSDYEIMPGKKQK